MEREACGCDHGLEISDLCAGIIIIIIFQQVSHITRGALLRPHLGAPRGASVPFSRVLKRTTSKGM